MLPYRKMDYKPIIYIYQKLSPHFVVLVCHQYDGLKKMCAYTSRASVPVGLGILETGPCVDVLFKCYACTSQMHPVIICVASYGCLFSCVDIILAHITYPDCCIGLLVTSIFKLMRIFR